MEKYSVHLSSCSTQSAVYTRIGTIIHLSHHNLCTGKLNALEIPNSNIGQFEHRELMSRNIQSTSRFLVLIVCISSLV